MMNTKPSPVSAPTLYTSTLLHAYPRVTTLADSIYSPAAYANAQGYLPFGPAPDSSAFYAPLNADCGDAWRSLSAQTAAAAAAAAAWVYEPSMVGYPYPASYGNLDVRRKNATRESTSTLKAWLYEHIKNPYPTKGEKIMLAIITKMTLTQVSTWFANARRRLKKENKMQWSPRNRTGDDDDDDDDKNSDNDDVIIGDRTSEEREESSGMMMMNDDDEDIVVDAGNDDSHPGSSDRGIDMAPIRCYTAAADDATRASSNGAQRPECIASRPEQQGAAAHRGFNIRTFAVGASGGNDCTSGVGCKGGGRDLAPTGSAVEKPRIWSLADVATSSVTPSSVYHRQRTSPSVTEQQLPVRTNDLLSHHHHHRYDVIPQSPAAASATSVVHHSFQPWTKRFLSAGPSIVAAPSSVHPFAHKLIPGYVPYLGLGGAQGFRQDPCAAVNCNGVDVVARSHAPPTTAAHVAGGGGGVVVGALSSPTPHRMEFAKVLTNGLVADERTVNPGGKYSSLTIGYISHPPSSSPPSSSSSSSAPILSNSSSSSSTSSPKSSPICSSASTTPSSPSSCHPLVPALLLPSASSQPSDKRS